VRKYAAAVAMNPLRFDSNQVGAINIGLKTHWKYANAKNDTAEEEETRPIYG
jgi:hypothetical protein